MGGIEGLASAASTERKTDETPLAKPPPAEEGPQVTRAEVARRAKEFLKRLSPGIGLAKIHGPVRVSAEGLTVLLGAPGGSGEFTILGSSNDKAQIDAVATSISRGSIAGLPPNLRLLVEIIRTQVFPPHALPASQDQRAKWIKAILDRSDPLCEEQESKKRAA